ncbi:peptidoglycan DD-metalloendopeptidase family protein [Ectothiorhodospiraceae bacterium 2226]|nr:peptidoglycan DD-metalloendopeptidase family protein [Ectothiorhodospiraceae bacterium 2226]
MRLVWLLLVVWLSLVGCAGGGHHPDQPRWIPATHKVAAGETLYGISFQYSLDYRRVADWNGIRPPYRIHPGQRLRLYPPGGHAVELARAQQPRAASSPSSAPATPARTAPMAVPEAGQPQRSAAVPSSGGTTAGGVRSPAPRAATPSSGGAVQWQWPLEGAILTTYNASNSGRRGIRIAGNPGQPVYAAAQGRVVYSGGGLIGYGRLVIIKHSDTFLSAYAHNRTLLVEEGESVKAGQQIAEVGNTGSTDRASLYFEIRHNGQPVDPLQHLPKRKL